jgi:Phage tail lysozyme
MGIFIPPVAEDAFIFLLSPGVDQGIARGPAAGIVAVCYAGESKLNPGSQGNQPTEAQGGVLNPVGAYGIASWGLRQAGLLKFATERGLPVENVHTQLLFIIYECAPHGPGAPGYPAVWDAIVRGASADEFVSIFVLHYEIPANPSAEINRSLPLALALEASALGPVPTPQPAPQPPPPSPPAPPEPPFPIFPTRDPEIQALEQIWSILGTLSPEAAARVAFYIYHRAWVPPST